MLAHLQRGQNVLNPAGKSTHRNPELRVKPPFGSFCICSRDMASAEFSGRHAHSLVAFGFTVNDEERAHRSVEFLRSEIARSLKSVAALSLDEALGCN